jgi:hypothetical protein
MKNLFSKLTPAQKALIMAACITTFGTIITAVATLFAADITKRREIDATQTAEAKLTLLQTIPSPTAPFSGRIPFKSLVNPNTLNTDLQWDAGSSDLSLYTFSTNGIFLTAGPHTWPNFPTIYYKQPVEGNFEIQVKVTFRSPLSKLSTAQMVGLVTRPVNDRLVVENSSFPLDWVVVAKYITTAGSLVGCRGSWADYSLDTVYLRIERADDIWRCAYSSNGENWIRGRVQIDNQLLLDKPLEIALFAYSDTDDAITVEFSDWSITRR